MTRINPLGDPGQASCTFIGLHPVHSDDQMRRHIQSLINLYPSLPAGTAAGLGEMENALFLDGIAAAV
ncbi:MAG: hypothetical protein IPM76_24300 [Chloroflexi bacterium]|nr:hypothetical protein [Chloroflexota bacterium]